MQAQWQSSAWTVPGQKQSTTCRVHVRLFALRDRLLRAARVGMLWALAATLALFIPVLHFVLVPAFLLIGLGLGVRALNKHSVATLAQGTCPACAQAVETSLPGQAPTSQLWSLCPHCDERLRIDAALMERAPQADTSTVAVACAAMALIATACTPTTPVEQQRALPEPSALSAHCEEIIGPPRVEAVADGIWVAIGYDLANTILIATEAGHVIVDPGMTRARARKVRQDLLAVAPGKVTALVYTHSHIDHVGGAAVWLESGDDIEIWATDAFTDHLLKQYGLFQPAEARRGRRQFGWGVSDGALPCSALGKRVDLEAAMNPGIRMPTRTFSKSTTLTVGGRTIELVEAHGETHDQLFVWVPDVRALLPGDNFYHAFPNLYTIRGASPRPIGAWIESLDHMRRRRPDVLIPSHTVPVTGAQAVARVLRDYRDAVQWVRDEVVRGANAGLSVDAIAERLALPEALADQRALLELYGQVDWSVRAIYDQALGWFDERPERLYPLAADERARREIDAMGGADDVLRQAAEARRSGDARWALHLLAKLRDAGVVERIETEYSRELVGALRTLGGRIANTNGRGYLLAEAAHVAGEAPDPPAPQLDEALLAGVPLETFFTVMGSRLSPERAGDTHAAVAFEFSDTEATFWVTVRHGIAEIASGAPMPDMPAPIATVVTDSMTWKQLAVGQLGAARAVASGALRIDGAKIAFLRWIRLFDRGF